MNDISAMDALERSLAARSNAHVPPDIAADEYLAQARTQLRASLIEPREIEAVADSESFGDFPHGTYRMWALAHCGTNWLLYSDETSTFHLGFGQGPGRPIHLWGYHSDDALQMWLA